MMSPMLRAFLENERGLKRFLGRFLPRAHDVDDVAQETFLRAFAAETDQDVRDPKAFLYKVARNLALNERARLSTRLTGSIEDFPDPSVLGQKDQVTGEQVMEGREMLAIFADAVSRLPDQCRKVFLLRKVQGLSQREVAAQLGISESTVEKHVAAGLVRCVDHLRSLGYEVGGGTPAPALTGVQLSRKARSGDV
jgi:RNA polymerase sigma factor (sigma-70 family)